jgi:hypothetical protein
MIAERGQSLKGIIAAEPTPLAVGTPGHVGDDGWVRISRTRLFGPQLRYVTGEVRMRGCGSGYRSSSRFIFSRDIHARGERRLGHSRGPMTRT